MENQFKWNDDLVNEACFFVGLKVDGNKDIINQIPDLVQNYKKSKEKKFLFKTQDGVGIFEGDTVFYPNIHVWIVTEVVADNVNTYRLKGINKYIPFSTEKLALEYIAWNKPNFSFAEIMANSIWHCGNETTERRSFSRQELRKLAKLKVGSADR